MSMTIKELLNIAEKRMADAGIPDSRIDAEIIFCHMMHFDRGKLFMNWGNSIDEKNCSGYFELIDVRVDGKPLQYITGRQHFMDISISVDERVLIPRQDTEVLVEEVNKYIKENRKEKAKVLDLCTGSGVIAISLAKANPGLKITASDISGDAIALAQKNAEATSTSKRIKFIQSDLFEELGRKKFDIIASNPPYIPTSLLPSLQKEIFEHEPLIALDGGYDGLDFYRKIIDKAPEFLKKDGVLFLEIGYDQGDAVSEIINAKLANKSIDIIKDLDNYDRIVKVCI